MHLHLSNSNTVSLLNLNLTKQLPCLPGVVVVVVMRVMSGGVRGLHGTWEEEMTIVIMNKLSSSYSSIFSIK